MALWDGLGQLYSAGGGTNYPWDTSPNGQIAQDLQRLKAKGVMWIRISIVPYSYTRREEYKVVGEMVKSYGFKTIFGVGAANVGAVNLTSWNNFKATIPYWAAYAQTMGYDVFCIGNEEASHNDKTTLTNQQVHDDERGEIALTAKTYFTGPVLYTGSAGEMPEFIANGKGNIDILGHNQYDNVQNFTNKIKATVDAFGADSLWVTEWNGEGGYTGVNTVGGGMQNENEYTETNMKRFHSLRGLGLKNTFFFQYGATKSADGLVQAYGLISGSAALSTPRPLHDTMFAAAGVGRIGTCL